MPRLPSFQLSCPFNPPVEIDPMSSGRKPFGRSTADLGAAGTERRYRHRSGVSVKGSVATPGLYRRGNLQIPATGSP